MMQQNPEFAIQSVQRAARLLKAFGDGATEWGVSDLSRKIHLHKSTVSRLLSTLEREGFVERVPNTDKFRVGFEVVRLAGQAPHFDDLRTTAYPALKRLADLSGETAILAVLDGEQAINIQQVSSNHLVRDSNWIGRRTPLHCVANGKALLAFSSAQLIERVLAQPLEQYTPETITDPVALAKNLAQIRQQGYAVACGEIEIGLNAIAAPVRNRRGDIVAAISVSGPSYRVTEDRIDDLIKLTRTSCNVVSGRLGFVNTSVKLSDTSA